jgi:hypothetical protein
VAIYLGPKRSVKNPEMPPAKGICSDPKIYNVIDIRTNHGRDGSRDVHWKARRVSNYGQGEVCYHHSPSPTFNGDNPQAWCRRRVNVGSWEVNTVLGRSKSILMMPRNRSDKGDPPADKGVDNSHHRPSGSH